jgi:hypothetical protein
VQLYSSMVMLRSLVSRHLNNDINRLTSLYAGSIMYSPTSNVCIVGSTNYRPTALIGVPTIFDLFLLVLTALKAIRNPNSLSMTDSIVGVKIQSSVSSKLTWNIIFLDVRIDPRRTSVRATASIMCTILTRLPHSYFFIIVSDYMTLILLF